MAGEVDVTMTRDARPKMLHPLQRRWWAEDLVRLRHSHERRRYAAPQRAGRIDPNPHQIDAVVFALSRLSDGGCILADEVGLGKTIEAGLVIAQRLAEGVQRILLIAPKPLLGQWRQELFELFGLETKEGSQDPASFAGPGIFLAGREFAAGPKGQSALMESGPMDLVVVDEAHELFGGLHRRFDRHGEYKPDAKEAKFAGRLFELLRAWDVPVLLLTATPIQNSLTELWSLVHYVDRTGTLLGQLPTFKELFCTDPTARRIQEGKETDLRQRLESVLKRTLRRQAQPFLEKPFVDRQARTFEYTLTPDERKLYDDVTTYLLQPKLAAFQGSQRRLLLIGFHRRMASSKEALAASLDKVIARLRSIANREEPSSHPGDLPDSDVQDFFRDLEEDPADERQKLPEAEGRSTPLSAEAVEAELRRVEEFARRAREMKSDAKLEAFLQATRLVQEQATAGKISGRMVIFTESLNTQDYLRRALVERGLFRDEEITLFRGNNEGTRARAALARWRAETGQAKGKVNQASSDVAARAALVHEFKTRTKVFISTEAGAKGLNLQFCETLVNYDLPWNPQRIEQRIGRCHRYGQKNAVTVLNFIAKDNEAERLTYEILSQKLNLFGTVLDATDQVLHAAEQTPAEALVSALGPQLEAELRRIYERARTREEIVEEIRRLREQMSERKEEFETTHRKTASVIESAFDDQVRQVFKGYREGLGPALAELDRDLEDVARAYLWALDVPHERTPDGRIDVSPHGGLPEGWTEGFSVAVGDHRELPSLHVGHPLIQAALAEARRASPLVRAVRIRAPEGEDFTALRGRRGRAILLWVRYDGHEVVDQLLPVIVMEGSDEALPKPVAKNLLHAPLSDVPAGPSPVDDEDLEDAIAEVLLDAGREVDQIEAAQHQRKAEQLERYMDDQAYLLKRRLSNLQRRFEQTREKQYSAIGVEDRQSAETQLEKTESELELLETELDRLQRRDDALYQRLRSRGLQRRYVPPTPSRLFDVQVEIA